MDWPNFRSVNNESRVRQLFFAVSSALALKPIGPFILLFWVSRIKKVSFEVQMKEFGNLHFEKTFICRNFQFKTFLRRFTDFDWDKRAFQDQGAWDSILAMACMENRRCRRYSRIWRRHMKLGHVELGHKELCRNRNMELPRKRS